MDFKGSYSYIERFKNRNKIATQHVKRAPRKDTKEQETVLTFFKLIDNHMYFYPKKLIINIGEISNSFDFIRNTTLSTGDNKSKEDTNSSKFRLIILNTQLP